MPVFKWVVKKENFLVRNSMNFIIKFQSIAKFERPYFQDFKFFHIKSCKVRNSFWNSLSNLSLISKTLRFINFIFKWNPIQFTPSLFSPLSKQENTPTVSLYRVWVSSICDISSDLHYSIFQSNIHKTLHWPFLMFLWKGFSFS